MIFRRRHTANFTTIGNELFEDQRLSADEVGILAYLLSRPNDWEVRRPALMRRWRIGRDAMKRIMNSWMRTGWCRAEKTRLSNGTFHVIYEIRDQPGPTLSDEEIRRALSLVSSESAADDDHADGDEAPDDPSATGDPPAGEPVAGDQGVATRHWPTKNLTNTDSEKTESPNRAGALARVIGKWNSDHILSRVTAESALALLSDKDFADCEAGIGPYLSDCRASNRKVCDLTTFVRERRWERFSAKAGQAKPSFFKARSPQWWRWREYRLATGQSVSYMDHKANSDPNSMWTESSEWPPAMPKKEAATADSISTEDAKALTGN